MSAISVSPDLLRPAVAAPNAGAGPLDDAKRVKIAKTANDFEASFTSVMLGQMFEGVETSAPFGGGEGEAAFKSFLTEAMAKAMTKHGGIGVAKVIQKELLKLQGLPSSAPVTPATAAKAYAGSAA